MKKLSKLSIILILSLILSLSLLISCADDSSGDGTSDPIDTTDTSLATDTTDTTDTVDSGNEESTDTEGTTDTFADSDVDVMNPSVEPDTDSDSDTVETESETDSDTDPDNKSIFKYVALGDSIAYGYALSSVEAERYSTLVGDHINSTHKDGALIYNYAVSGDKSGDLIALIEAGKTPELRDADLVTISIGANNVLAPALEKLAEYMLYMAIEDENLRNMQLPSLYTELMTETQDGIVTFGEEIVTVIEKIRELAPDAQIIFQTIYNPYRNVSLTLDFVDNTLDLANETDRLVTALNAVITGNAETLGFDVVDIYSAYEELTDVVNADSFDGDITNMIISADPHPNAKGHRVIADAITPIIKLD